MTAEQLETSRRRFEIAGAIICAHCFGYLLWGVSDSHGGGPPSNDEYANLIGYIALALSCYLGAFRFLDRYCVPPFQSIRLNWVFISILGTSLSFTLASFWLIHLDDRMDRFIAGFLLILGFLNLLILPVMTLVWSAGYIFRLVVREINYSKVVMD